MSPPTSKTAKLSPFTSTRVARREVSEDAWIQKSAPTLTTVCDSCSESRSLKVGSPALRSFTLNHLRTYSPRCWSAAILPRLRARIIDQLAINLFVVCRHHVG